MGYFPYATVRARFLKRCVLEERTSPVMVNDDEFQAVIRRNSSMTPRSMAVVIICFAVLTVTFSLSFLTLGYWLILPFAGLEILAIAAAMAVTVRSTTDYELITVKDEKVTIIKRQGERTVTHDFQRYWTRIRRERGANRLQPTHLLVGSHGRFVAIGSALTEQVKDKLAQQIRDAIRYHGPQVHNNVSE